MFILILAITALTAVGWLGAVLYDAAIGARPLPQDRPAIPSRDRSETLAPDEVDPRRHAA